MINKIKNHVRKIEKRHKYIIATVLVLIVVSLIVVIIFDMTHRSLLKRVAQENLTGSEYFVKYNGYNLTYDYMKRQECYNCYTVYFTFYINTDLLLKNLTGFHAAVGMENDEPTQINYVKIIR